MQVKVKILDLNVEVDVEQLTNSLIEQAVKDYNVGGITDPLGQLISWLWDQIKSSFYWLRDTIYSYFTTFRDWILSGVRAIIDGLWASVQAIGNSIVSAIGNIQSFISTAVSTIYSYFTELSTAISTFFSTVMTQIESAINTVSTAISNIFSTIMTSIQSAFNTVMTAIQSFINTLTAIGSQVMSAITSAINTITSAIQSAFQYVSNAIQSFIQQAIAFFTQIYNMISSALQSFIAQLQNIGSYIYNSLTAVGQQIATFFTNIYNSIVSGFQTVQAWIQQAWNTVTATLQQIYNGFLTLSNMIRRSFEEVIKSFEMIRQAFTGFVNALAQIYSWLTVEVPKMFQQFMDVVTNFPKVVWEWFQKTREDIVKFFTTLAEQITIGATRIGETIRSFVSSVIEGIKGTIENAVKTILSTLGNIIKIVIESLGGTSLDEVITKVMNVLVPLLFIGIPAYVSVDLLTTKIAGCGLELDTIKNFIQQVIPVGNVMQSMISSIVTAGLLIPFSYIINYQYRPKIVDPTTTITAYWRELITEEQLDKLLGFHGFRDEQYKIMIEASRPLPSYKDLFIMYCKDIIDLDTYKKVFKWLGWKDEWVQRLTRHMYFDLRLFDLYRIYDTVFPKPDWLSAKLQIWGFTKDDAEQVIFSILRRPIRDEVRRIIYGLIELAEMGLIKVEDIPKYFKQIAEKSEVEVRYTEHLYEGTRQHTFRAPVFYLSDYELNALVEYARMRRERYIARETLRVLTRALRRGAITKEEFVRKVTDLGYPENLAKIIAEAEAPTYELSLGWLMSFADYIELPENYVDKKLELLGVPEEDRKIIKEVLKIKPLRDERRRIIWAVIELYEIGLYNERDLEDILKQLGLRPEEINLLKQYAQLLRRRYLRNLEYRVIITALRRGKITTEEAIRKLRELGLPENLAKMIVEVEGKTYTLSLSTLLYYADYVPIEEQFLQKKLDQLGVPEDERGIVKQVFKVKPIRDEREKIFYDLVDAYRKGYLTDEELTRYLRELGYTEKEIALRKLHAKFARLSYVRYLRERTLDLLFEYNLISEEDYRRALRELGMSDDMINEKIAYIVARKEKQKYARYRV
ncbi:MAG: hypothetical protein DRJ40_11080 [Thermoprotei archaeon]|nr:MAG: hypothetical protein DRJ40_11080 [Thermoprotei archaeon]